MMVSGPKIVNSVVCLFDLTIMCLSACTPVCLCVSTCPVCVCTSLQQQQQQNANPPTNALGSSLGPQLVSSQTPMHSTPPSAASTAGGATNLPHPQPSSRSSTPTLPGPVQSQGATTPCPTQPQPQVELSTAAQTQPLPQPPTTPVRLRTLRMPSTLNLPFHPSDCHGSIRPIYIQFSYFRIFTASIIMGMLAIERVKCY